MVNWWKISQKPSRDYRTFFLTFLQKLRKSNRGNSRFFNLKFVNRLVVLPSRQDEVSNFNSQNNTMFGPRLHFKSKI